MQLGVDESQLRRIARASRIASAIGDQSASAAGERRGTDSTGLVEVTLDSSFRPTSLALSTDWRTRAPSGLDRALTEAFAAASTADLPLDAPDAEGADAADGEDSDLLADHRAVIAATERALPDNLLSERARAQRDDIREELTALADRLRVLNGQVLAAADKSVSADSADTGATFQRVSVNVRGLAVVGVRCDPGWIRSARNEQIEQTVMEAVRDAQDAAYDGSVWADAEKFTSDVRSLGDTADILRRAGAIE